MSAVAVPRPSAEHSGLLRSPLAGRRMRLVLDDAGSAAQVRDLLPGAPGAGWPSPAGHRSPGCR
ncbi:hypothetical protein P9869_06920 [Streptomyces ossamyceticus]|nr:hypothetical protein [Streptomyces ossamyceticus]